MNNLTEPSVDTVGQRAVSGFRWLTAFRVAGQAIQWAITLLVIRLLSPADYGVMAMAVVLQELLSLLADMGIGLALIQAKEVADRTWRQAFAAVLGVHLVLAMLMLGGAGPASGFFHEPQVQPIIRLLAVQFLLNAFHVLPHAFLMRRLAYRQTAAVDFVAALAGGCVTLLLAWNGYGVWSLVWGHLAFVAARVVGVNSLARFFPRPLFSLAGMRELCSFGGILVLERMIWYLYSRADVMIVGRLLGKVPLGVYAVAKELAFTPVSKAVPIITPIVFPTFARIQNDPERVARYLQRGIHLVALIGFPAALGISNVAPELVSVFLGDQWLPAVLPLMVLTLISPLQTTINIISTVLKSLGEARLSLENILIAALMIPAGCVIGSQWGPFGVAMAWGICYPIYFLIALARALRRMDIPALPIARVLATPLAAAALMYAALAWLRSSMDQAMQPYLTLMILVGSGVLIYAVLLFLLDRQGLKGLAKLAGLPC